MYDTGYGHIKNEKKNAFHEHRIYKRTHTVHANIVFLYINKNQRMVNASKIDKR